MMFIVTTANGQNKKNKSKEKKQMVLFDGKSTDQWKDIKSDAFPAHGWVVKDDVLTVLAKTKKSDAIRTQDRVTMENMFVLTLHTGAMDDNCT
jgi:hypothetical protein